MKSENKTVGIFGENSVCTYLKHRGYKILDRNYSNYFGEIDIIAKKGEYVIFVEVKTRKSDDYGNPADAVNYTKQQKIYRTAQSYILENNLDADYRFDIVEVMYKPTVFGGFKTYKINHIENAFW